VHLDLTLREWVNDGAMAIFFFVVGLEIKRELVLGELRDRRAAALPAIAAVGGMVVPALVYTAFNAGGEGSSGWGIPMATDIAFAIGVHLAPRRRVPSGAKLFLLALAIVDDLGAILVIAFFYTDSLSFAWLAFALAACGVAYLLKRVDVRSLLPYGLAAVACWYGLHESGVHATLAGVAFGFLTPAWAFYDPNRFVPRARRVVDRVGRALHGEDTSDDHAVSETALRDLVRLAAESQSPLQRIEHRLAPWVSFLIVPDLRGRQRRRVAVRRRAGRGAREPHRARRGAGARRRQDGRRVRRDLARRPVRRRPPPRGHHLAPRDRPRHLRGIGFTVALFVASLSFTDGAPPTPPRSGSSAGAWSPGSPATCSCAPPRRRPGGAVLPSSGRSRHRRSHRSAAEVRPGLSGPGTGRLAASAPQRPARAASSVAASHVGVTPGQVSRWSTAALERPPVGLAEAVGQQPEVAGARGRGRSSAPSHGAVNVSSGIPSRSPAWTTVPYHPSSTDRRPAATTASTSRSPGGGRRPSWAITSASWSTPRS
jgi:NhaA family Na+:H+ antiporter